MNTSAGTTLRQTPGLLAAGAKGLFPILSGGGTLLVYLDSGASTQKPGSVIEAEAAFYQSSYANIHRGVYKLSQQATDAYETARAKVAAFIGCKDPAEVIFTRGTTESINLVAAGFGQKELQPGDEIILSQLEHHSNIVPWQMAAERAGAIIKVIPINDAGELLLDEYEKLLTPRAKIVAVTHLSNALGSITDVVRIVKAAKRVGAAVLIDGAQWVGHFPTNVLELGADFYVFSAHKLYGPSGVGVLWGKRAWLERLPAYQGGGDMIERVSFAKTTYAGLPNKFEAGTPNIAGVVALGAAVDFMKQFDFAELHAHEQRLLQMATAGVEALPGMKVVGKAGNKASVLSFVSADFSSLDLGTKLDEQGVAVRTGHHCCMPLMERLGVAGTTRVSLGLYNTAQDIEQFLAALKKIVESGKKAAGAAQPEKKNVAERVDWPGAAGETPLAVADELAEAFEFLGERDARNQYLLDLASQLPRTLELLKVVPDSRVHGCMSTVHLVSKSDERGRMIFVADSDAEIVRGLIAVLQKLYSGQKPGDVLAFDVEGFFRRIGLDQFVTSQRRNGLAGMVSRIRAAAGELAKQSAKAEVGR